METQQMAALVNNAHAIVKVMCQEAHVTMTRERVTVFIIQKGNVVKSVKQGFMVIQGMEVNVSCLASDRIS